tara:strand:+ start:341 stop:1027 length:687 start_codon:yes stop_codon:yes gene_type:complete
VYLYFYSQLFIGIKYPVKKKIIVRYHAGSGGRFIACLTQMILDPTFTFELDQHGGVHTFKGGDISDTVSETHDRLLDCVLNNLDTDLYLIQITVTPDYEDAVLKNYWVKCLCKYWAVDEINRITQTQHLFTDTDWAKRQLFKLYEEIDPKLRDILRQDLRGHPDSTKPHIHPRVLNLMSGDVFQGTMVIDKIAEFLGIEQFDREPAESMLDLYVHSQPLLRKELLESN